MLPASSSVPPPRPIPRHSLFPSPILSPYHPYASNHILILLVQTQPTLPMLNTTCSHFLQQSSLTLSAFTSLSQSSFTWTHTASQFSQYSFSHLQFTIPTPKTFHLPHTIICPPPNLSSQLSVPPNPPNQFVFPSYTQNMPLVPNILSQPIYSSKQPPVPLQPLIPTQQSTYLIASILLSTCCHLRASSQTHTTKCHHNHPQNSALLRTATFPNQLPPACYPFHLSAYPKPTLQPSFIPNSACQPPLQVSWSPDWAATPQPAPNKFISRSQTTQTKAYYPSSASMPQPPVTSQTSHFSTPVTPPNLWLPVS